MLARVRHRYRGGVLIDEGSELGARVARRLREGDRRVADDGGAVRRSSAAPGGVPVGRRRWLRTLRFSVPRRIRLTRIDGR